MLDDQLDERLLGNANHANPDHANPDHGYNCSDYLYLLLQYFSPCTSQANDLTLIHETDLRFAALQERATPEATALWQSSRLHQIRYPGNGQREPSDVEAQQLRHKELNVRRGIRLGFLLLLTAGAAALGATLSTNNRSSSSPFVPPVPDNSSQFPSAVPTFYPTEFTNWPTLEPTWTPTEITSGPTLVPTHQPSEGSSSPTVAPTPWPTSQGQVVVSYQQPDTSSWGCSQGGACYGYPGQGLSLTGGGSDEYTAVIQSTGETQLFNCDLTNTDQVAALNEWFSQGLQCQYYPAEAQADLEMVLKDPSSNELSDTAYSQTLFSTRRLRGGSSSAENKNSDRQEERLTVRS